MSKQQHTPEPWEIEQESWCGHPNCPEGHVTILLTDAKGLPVARCDADGRERAAQVVRDFGRIAACVNACKGVPSRLLEAAAANGGLLPLLERSHGALDSLMAALVLAKTEPPFMPSQSGEIWETVKALADFLRHAKGE